MASTTEYNITDNQRLFADEYIKTGKAAESYMKFYKAKGNAANVNASRLLSNANIKEYIENMNKKLENSTIADMAEIKAFWTSLLREGKETFDIDGKQTKSIIDTNARLKASEFLAKTNGAFIDKQEVNGNLELQIKITKV